MIQTYKNITYIPTFQGNVIELRELEDIKSFIESESFNILTLNLVSKMIKLRNYENLNIIKLYKSCGLLNVDKEINGIYPTYKIIFTSFLRRGEKLVIDIKLRKNTIKSYEDIKYIQNVISDIDRYYSFKGMINFNYKQHLEEELRKKLFKRSLEDFIEYLSIIKKEK